MTLNQDNDGQRRESAKLPAEFFFSYLKENWLKLTADKT